MPKPKLINYIWMASLVFLMAISLRGLPPTITTDFPLLINYFLRISGILGMTLLFWRIVLAQFKAVNKSFLTLTSFAGYGFIFIHPLLHTIYWFKLRNVVDPFYVYTDICGLCDDLPTYATTFGKLAFWTLTATTLWQVTKVKPAVYKWLKRHHLKYLNYFAFALVTIHSLVLASDSVKQIYTLALALIVGAAVVRNKKF